MHPINRIDKLLPWNVAAALRGEDNPPNSPPESNALECGISEQSSAIMAVSAGSNVRTGFRLSNVLEVVDTLDPSPPIRSPERRGGEVSEMVCQPLANVQ